MTDSPSTHPLYPEVQQTFLDFMNDAEAAQIATQAVLDGSDPHWQVSLLEHLLGLNLNAEEAQKFWHHGVAHWEDLKTKLNRNPGLTVALMDYFINIAEDDHHFKIYSKGSRELLTESPRDGLTGLSSLGHFKSRLNAEAARSLRYQNPFVVAIIDIDAFKTLVSDRGPEAANEVFRRMGPILQDACRQTDIASRIGRQQFALLLPETEKLAAYIQVESIRTRAEIDLKEFQTTVSGGLAACPPDAQTAEEIMAFAETSLAAAKAHGGNRVCMDADDRRAFPRLRESLLVRLTPLAEKESSDEAITSDISGGGFAFEHSQSFAIGQPVKGEIELPEVIVTFLGQVVRMAELSSGRYEVGIMFTAIDPESRYQLLAYAHS